MAVSFASGRRRGKASAEPPSLFELLPKSARSLASPLSRDEQDVLAYLVAFGRHMDLLSGTLPPVCKSVWKPWKKSAASSSSKVSDAAAINRQQVVSSRSSSFLAPQFASMRLPGETGCRKALSLLIHKPSSRCDCFACYSSFWSRWNASPNRDLINKILEIVEMQEERPQVSKGKKKKQDKMQELENEADCKKSEGGKGKRQGDVVQTTVEALASSMLTDMKACRVVQTMDDTSMSADMKDEAPRVATHVMDHASWAEDSKDEAPRVVTQMMDAVPRLTEAKAKVSTKLTDVKDEAPRAPEMKNETYRVSGMTGEALSRVSEMKAKADAIKEAELDGSLTIQASLAIVGGLSLACTQGKNSPKLQQHQRAGKRKSNQVTPLDCEGSLASVEEEEEPGAANETAQSSIAARVADTNLRGRGFLARVFPDALGGVASRLWDLVSFRWRSRTVDYY